MEAALVTAATGALKPVLEKLAALLGDKYKRLKGVRVEIKSLMHELVAMDAFLLKMSEEKDPDVQDKVWMNEVRELSYDMEDSIDDFMKHVDDKDANPDGFMEKIKYSLRKMTARHRIGDEIEDLKKQITEVGLRNARYKTRQTFSNTIKATVDPRALVIFEHASKLVGIDEPKGEIIKLLTEGASKQEQPKLVSIVGSGGLGKTTLANQVYQDLKAKFECRAFLTVSQNPDMMNILRTILSEVTGQGYADTEAGSIQQLISKITDFLADKRYFVVVDDIWDVLTWEIINKAFPMTSPGSVVIITTRKNDIVESCRSSFDVHIHKMDRLNDVHSRELFNKRLFGPKEKCPSHLEDISCQILEKCAGLPLAIIGICGLLANKERRHDLWDQVKSSIGRGLERSDDVQRMINILSLSYFDLPPHLKTCLLYLSVFPEDYIINRKALIRRWIAEGFIHKESGYTSHELGESYFNELINRSLIQPLYQDRYDKVVYCRVHDIVFDFILAKSKEDNFVRIVGVSVQNENQINVRRLSIQVGKKVGEEVEEKGDSVLQMSKLLSHVRSFNVFVRSRKIPCFDEFKYLRLLDFGCCYQLENHHLANIGRLLQLRYLNLRKTKVSELPEQVGGLRCLEMLDIRDTVVPELPAAIVKLGKLVDLLIEPNVKFPDGIAMMQALETLEQIGIQKQPLKFLQQVFRLKNLRELHLDFCAAGDTTLVKECVKTIDNFYNLRSLTIVNDENFILESWCRPSLLRLQTLITWSSTIPKVPDWVGSLVNLQQLRLEVERVRQEDLLTFGGLPALLTLDLLVVTARSSKDMLLTVSGEVGFQCLRKFCYEVGSQGMDLMFEAGAMPKLKYLEIGFDACVESTHSSSDAFDSGIQNLPCLVNVRCRVGDHVETSIEAAKAAMERSMRACMHT